MYMIEIETNEMDKASEYAEKALKYMGKVLQCLTEWGEEGGYGERSGQGGGSYDSRYGMRSRYDNYGRRGDYGYRDDEEWEMDDEMGERRRRSRRTGRYM